jgi:hypothetical protein
MTAKLEDLGLEVTEGSVEVGETYPLYGMITDFLGVGESGKTEVMLNFSIKLTMNITDADKIELLKDKSFEPGIFFTTVKEIDYDRDDYKVAGDCQTVVFGKTTTPVV